MAIRFIILLCFLCLSESISAQMDVPQYMLTKDSATHTTVVLTDGAQYRRIKSYVVNAPLVAITPDIKLKTGIVDYKNLTGELYVRKYYLNDKLLGYAEYDGDKVKRELFYDAQGNISLEKRYDKGYLIYTDNKIQITKKK